MKIRKAMKLVDCGKKVRRRDWNLGVYCKLDGLKIEFYSDQNGREQLYYLNILDILADDWEIVE